MKEKDILYFEEDDAATSNDDGKQIFVAKRINGKTTRNKGKDNSVKLVQREENKKQIEEIIIGIDNFNISESPNSINSAGKNKKKNTKEKKQEERTKNNKRKSNNKTNRLKAKNIPKRNLSKEQIRKAEKRKKRNRVLKIFTLIFLIIGTLVLALVSPIFNIQKIEVLENEKLSAEEIINLSGLEKRK